MYLVANYSEPMWVRLIAFRWGALSKSNQEKNILLQKKYCCWKLGLNVQFWKINAFVPLRIWCLNAWRFFTDLRTGLLCRFYNEYSEVNHTRILYIRSLCRYWLELNVAYFSCFLSTAVWAIAKFAYDQNSPSFTVLYSRLAIYLLSHIGGCWVYSTAPVSPLVWCTYLN